MNDMGETKKKGKSGKDFAKECLKGHEHDMGVGMTDSEESPKQPKAFKSAAPKFKSQKAPKTSGGGGMGSMGGM